MKKKPGYHVIGMYLPEPIWQRTMREADKYNFSATQIVTYALAEYFGIGEQFQLKRRAKPKGRRR